MSSLIAHLKDFVFNRVLTRAPQGFLYFLYEYKLKKARSDLLAISNDWVTYVAQELERIKKITEPIKTSFPLVVGLVGLPHTGKTTVAKAIAGEAGLIRIDSNLIRNWLIQHGRNYANIDAILLFFIEECLKSGRGVVIDSDNMLPIKRKLVQVVARRNNCDRIAYVRVDTPDDFQEELLSRGEIHKMYYDAVRLSNPEYTHTSVPFDLVAECVRQERARQKAGHRKYGSTLYYFSALINFRTQMALEYSATTCAREMLSLFGTEHTSFHIANKYQIFPSSHRYDVYHPALQ